MATYSTEDQCNSQGAVDCMSASFLVHQQAGPLQHAAVRVYVQHRLPVWRRSLLHGCAHVAVLQSVLYVCSVKVHWPPLFLALGLWSGSVQEVCVQLCERHVSAFAYVFFDPDNDSRVPSIAWFDMPAACRLPRL
jgi:hypothetical protein